MEGNRLSKSRVGLLALVGAVALISIIVFTLNKDKSSITVIGPGEVMPGLNTAVSIGSFNVSVTEVSEKEGNDTKTVTLNVSAYNASKSADQFYGDQVVLRDADGREYKASPGGFGRATINPGISEKGTLTYTVPANAEVVSAMIRAEMVDNGGAKYTRIDLTK